MPGGVPTIVFFPEGAFGPTNNCVGIADVLRRHGARVIFVIEESFRGTLEAKGFGEALMRLKAQAPSEEAPGQFWKDFIRETAPEFRKPTLDQIETLIRPIWSELITGSMYVDARLDEIFESVGPDVIVQDNVVAFGAVASAGVPWVRIVSCNPLEIPDPALPPALSGLPTGDRRDWDEFRRVYRELHAPLRRQFSEYLLDHGAPRLPEGAFMYESPVLNLYNYPEELDYQRSEALAMTWMRLESCVRATDEPFHLPEMAAGGKVIYLSLGSLGSADAGLMNRLIEMLSHRGHRVIVSMGPQHQEIVLGDNMWGREFLPQTSILPLVDLVITHGGNNTVTESLYFGKPMIVMPLFWDQPDNAQRIQESGVGVRLDPYRCSEGEFLGWVDTLLADDRLRRRLGGLSTRLQARPGTQQAARLIEQVARSRSSSGARR